MYFKKRIIILSFMLIFSTFFAFSETNETGKMLIMGWEFNENDPVLQTNIAIDAILHYLEAAKLQMSSELSSTSPHIELYKFVYPFDDIIYNKGAAFIYIDLKSNSVDDYFDRYIEIIFYVIVNGLQENYKLVLNYQNYSWVKNNDIKLLFWKLILEDELAYNFFITEINNFRR